MDDGVLRIVAVAVSATSSPLLVAIAVLWKRLKEVEDKRDELGRVLAEVLESQHDS